MYPLIQPSFQIVAEKKLVGLAQAMRVTNHRVASLWKAFIPLRTAVLNVASSKLISLTAYPAGYFDNLTPGTSFTKWAALEVSEFAVGSKHVNTMTLERGRYAVFHYKGLSSDCRIFDYIFCDWLPQSEYWLDGRPHFEILGPNFHPKAHNQKKRFTFQFGQRV